MDDDLQCPVCFESYDYDDHRPLLLPVCGHTFCKACLQSGRISKCPEDRSLIRDLEGLPTNILALRAIGARGERIPGMEAGVKLIRSEDVELLNRVGEGGTGVVWEASYKGKQVAVKVFHSSLSSQDKSSTPPHTRSSSDTTSSSFGGSMCASSDPLLRAFAKEVELLQLVSEDSMYCCRLYGVMVKDNRPCIVMKWFGHGHLQVPAGGYDPSLALQWGLAIAKALADVHALGIVVADLKPENVLISDQGDPVLADFGISSRVSTTLATLTQGRSNKTTTMQTIKGTPYYMSPEQWSAGKLTNRSDVWSWGCLMVELMTGAPPWLGLNMFQVMGKVAMQRATPQVPPGFPGWLSDLVSSCFAYQPANRPSAAEVVACLKANTMLSMGPTGASTAPTRPEDTACKTASVSTTSTAQPSAPPLLDAPATRSTTEGSRPAANSSTSNGTRPCADAQKAHTSTPCSGSCSSEWDLRVSPAAGAASSNQANWSSASVLGNQHNMPLSSHGGSSLVEVPALAAAAAAARGDQGSGPGQHITAADGGIPTQELVRQLEQTFPCSATARGLLQQNPAAAAAAAAAAASGSRTGPLSGQAELPASHGSSSAYQRYLALKRPVAVAPGMDPLSSSTAAVGCSPAAQSRWQQWQQWLLQQWQQVPPAAAYSSTPQAGASYMAKSIVTWVQQLNSPGPQHQLAAASGLLNELKYATTAGGHVKRGDTADCIIAAGGIQALARLLKQCATSDATLLLAQQRAAVLLDRLVAARPHCRAEIEATGVWETVLRLKWLEEPIRIEAPVCAQQGTLMWGQHLAVVK